MLCQSVVTPRKAYGLAELFDIYAKGKGKRNGEDAVFFNWDQTSARLCVSGSQKFLGKIGLTLKLRDVKICSSFFFSNIFLIGNLAILEIQDRFIFNNLQTIYEKMMSRFLHP